MTRKKYKLGFLDDDVIYSYVKSYVEQFSTEIDLKRFNSNIVDPIKLTFDSKVYGKTLEEAILDECTRQIDKANSNVLGYFHQNLFKLVGNGWTVPEKGFDIVNARRKIYVEMKNKHNTMNASAARDTMLTMLNKVSKDSKAVCMLVEVIAKKSQMIQWKGSFKGQNISHERILRVSIDRFYEIVFGDKNAFCKLCKALPLILDDVVKELGKGCIKNSVLTEMKKKHVDTNKQLYMLAFSTYEGFGKF